MAAAFKLDEKNSLNKEEKGTAHIGVFSFLPLKEIPSGLHFLVQADFLTMTGRGELARNCQWNNWLAAQLYQLIIDKCIPAFLRHEQWKYQFTDSLYTSSGGHELFELHLKKPLREYLLYHPVLIAEDETPLRAEQALAMDSLRNIVAAKDVERLYPNKKMLHPRCTPPPEIQSRIEHGPGWNEHEKLHRLLQLKAEDEDLPFFKAFYQQYLIPLAEKHRLTADRKIILTDGFGLADIHSAALNLENVAIPKSIRDFFKLVHPSLVQDPDIGEFFQLMGVPIISEDDVQNLLRKKELVYLQQHWPSLPETTKIEKLRICKELWEKGSVAIPHLEFLTLPNTLGEWREPQQLLLSHAYQPPHALETLQQRGLLDFPLEFVDGTFAESGQPERWREFLRAVGVDARMNERRFRKNLIERIGILLVMNYEESRGRKASEIPRSKEIFGYDITIDNEEGEGYVQSAERYIEVKSSEKPNPDIFLTTRQYSTLQEKRDKYFVYIVTDALKSPTLHITRGDKLLKITHIRTLIPFRKWWYEAKEEEYKGES